MKFLIIFVIAIIGSQAGSFSDKLEEQWTSFKMTYNKQYKNDFEERVRMKIFMENVHKIAKHNELYEMGQFTYKLGLNKYADMTNHEFVQTLNGFNRTKSLHRRVQTGDTFIPPAHDTLPDSVDWRKKGAVTAVKDQEECGACWSFSTTGALEGQYFIKTGKLVSLSEQNLVDCDTYNDGCDGGTPQDAYRFIKENGGIDTEAAYPYIAEKDWCYYSPKGKGATVRGFIFFYTGNEAILQESVTQVGPVCVAIDASHDTFRFYSEGVYYEPDCSSDKLDHSVLAVGYGTDEKGGDYWLVKNSWSTSWGENGYVKMARNRNNSCGIATEVVFPIV